jgi:hypothetical protein
MKIRPVAAEFHAARVAGMAKLNVAFHTFTIAPKNLQYIFTIILIVGPNILVVSLKKQPTNMSWK